MDIERVNENTIKLFITYRDIEDRGYSREEIWYNRAKGEELFWDMIGEINTDDYFDLDGPIWIHVNASEQGLEVIVTRASMNSDIESNHIMAELDEQESIDELDESIFEVYNEAKSSTQPASNLTIYKFQEIDELIPVAKRLLSLNLKSSLYEFEKGYYLAIYYKENCTKKEKDNISSIVNEYLNKSKVTIYRLEEYGHKIMDGNCFETIVQYFE